jgi:ABC-type multidrug transport system ATPase subunit
MLTVSFGATISGGQRELVTFARARVAEADILILDEPTSALDWIGKLSRNDGLTTILMSTHHLHHAPAAADEALLMLGQTDYYFARPNRSSTSRTRMRSPRRQCRLPHWPGSTVIRWVLLILRLMIETSLQFY